MRSLAIAPLALLITLACWTANAGAAVYPLGASERVAATPGETIELLDFDNDGLLDIASVHGEFLTQGGDVNLVRGITEGWAAEQRVTVPGVRGPVSDIAAADVTGDGREDILAAFGGDSGHLAVLRGNLSAGGSSHGQTRSNRASKQRRRIVTDSSQVAIETLAFRNEDNVSQLKY